MSFLQVNEEELEDQQYFKKLRKRLIRDFSEVFKENLEPTDWLDIEPVVIEWVHNYDQIRPFNCMVPAETPAI